MTDELSGYGQPECCFNSTYGDNIGQREIYGNQENLAMWPQVNAGYLEESTASKRIQPHKTAK
jgi:hypothetical protein